MTVYKIIKYEVALEEGLLNELGTNQNNTKKQDPGR